jgi:hypothetical protein|tara:strand:- start:664 stop:819 length:156 start_codon:yes stop_codon:yes gene_type:complete
MSFESNKIQNMGGAGIGQNQFSNNQQRVQQPSMIRGQPAPMIYGQDDSQQQ